MANTTNSNTGGTWIVPMPNNKPARTMPFNDYVKLTDEKKKEFNNWSFNNWSNKKE